MIAMFSLNLTNGHITGENVKTLVDEGAIGALVPHLRAPIPVDKDGTVPYEHEVEKYAAYALGLLATKVWMHIIFSSVTDFGRNSNWIQSIYIIISAVWYRLTTKISLWREVL
jgi:hypothetical protein